VASTVTARVAALHRNTGQRREPTTTKHDTTPHQNAANHQSNGWQPSRAAAPERSLGCRRGWAALQTPVRTTPLTEHIYSLLSWPSDQLARNANLAVPQQPVVPLLSWGDSVRLVPIITSDLPATTADTMHLTRCCQLHHNTSGGRSAAPGRHTGIRQMGQATLTSGDCTRENGESQLSRQGLGS